MSIFRQQMSILLPQNNSNTENSKHFENICSHKKVYDDYSSYHLKLRIEILKLYYFSKSQNETCQSD